MPHDELQWYDTVIGHAHSSAGLSLIVWPECSVILAEKATVLVGKLCHYGLLLGLPALLHGWPAALAGAAGYSINLSILLALMFFVSHNVPENKPGTAKGEETQKVWLIAANE
jgi:hypothetical protein